MVAAGSHSGVDALLDPRTAPALYIDCGTEDRFLLHDAAAYLHDILLSGGIGHDFTFWTARLPKSLFFLTAHTESRHVGTR